TPNGGGGSNVQIEVSDGSHTFKWDGADQKGCLLTDPNTGQCLPVGLSIRGVTHKVTQGGVIIGAFIFVPRNPTIQGVGSRGIGNGAKMALAIHEIIHVYGLEETDPGHSPNGNPDVFMTGTSFSGSFPPDGVPGDRFDLGGGKFVPPIFITDRTATL